MNPKKIGRYEIETLIGRGGMGSVFKALDPMIGRTVAIKTINMDHMDSEESRIQFKKRFFQEARICGKVSHPGILAIHDIGEVDGEPFIATEFIDGTQLNRYIHDHRPLDGETLADLLHQIADALDFAHDHGIVHRDIKPHNIMVTRDQKIKILDFGLAKLTESEMTHLTRPGEFLGSPSYSSPEQVRGEKVDKRSDLFSFAVLAYEMISGKRPFKGENVNAVLFRVVSGVPDSIALPQNLPDAAGRTLHDIFQKAMHKKPDYRFQKAELLVEELVKVVRDGDYAWTWQAKTEPATQEHADRSLLQLDTPEVWMTEPATRWHRAEEAPPVRIASHVTVTSPSARQYPGGRPGKVKTPRRPYLVWLGASALAVVLAGFLWWWLAGPSTDTPPPDLATNQGPEANQPVGLPVVEDTATTSDTLDATPEMAGEEIPPETVPARSETPQPEVEIPTSPKNLLSFPDPGFNRYLIAQFDRDGDGRISVTEAEAVTTIDTPGEPGKPSSIRDLTGLSYFTNLRSLNCAHESLISLPALPTNLRRLTCDGNALTALPALPPNLETLSANDNRLYAIDTPPQGLVSLSLNGNQLRELPTLPSALKQLRLAENLFSAPPSVPAGLGLLDLRNNQLSSDDCEALGQLAVERLDVSPQSGGALDCAALAAAERESQAQLVAARTQFDSALADQNLEGARNGYTRLENAGESDEVRLIQLQHLEAKQFQQAYQPGTQLPAHLIDRFQKAAALGDAISQYTVGFLFERGIGAKVDPFEAKKWYERAAEQGHLDALFGLGKIYEQGEAVPKDDERAARFYLEAAEKGHTRSQHRVGEMLRTGQGLDKAEERAVTWFKQAADQDYAPAQASLGFMYQKGLGVKGSRRENRDLALYWYCRAASSGNGQAKMALRVMRKKPEDCPGILSQKQPD